MASVFLDSNDTFTVSNNNVRVFGAATGTEVVTVGAGVTGVVLDQSVERVALGAAPGAYTYQQQGINLVVYSGTTVVTTVPLQAGANGTALTFTTGTVKAVVSATGMTLGGTAVTAGTTAAAATAVVPTVIDNTVTSTPVVTTPVLPTLSVAAASLAEGNTGSANMTFTVSLSAASTSAVTVAYATTNGTAVAGSDFTATSGTLTIAAGSTSGTVTVPVLGETLFETNEAFTLTLSNPTNATVSTASATGTITNDDTNALPAIVVPTSAAAAFIGNSSVISGISITDADDNAGFTVTLQATGSSQLVLTSLTATSGNAVGAVNAAGTAVAANTSSNLITLSGTKADINSVLANLKYATNSTTPTTESIALTVTDPNGGRTTGSLTVNVGSNLTLTANSDNLQGSSGDDLFTGTLAHLGAADILVGGLGNDKLTLTEIGVGGASGTLPTFTTASTGIDVLDLTTNAAAATTETATFSAANFGTSLTTVNFTTKGNAGATDATDSLTATTANAGTVFNIQNSAATLTISAINGTAGTTDAFTVNLAGGTTLTSITGTGSFVDALTIGSNGTTANTVTGITTLTNDAVITLTGSQALTITLPNEDFSLVNAGSAQGKVTVNGQLVNNATGLQFAITGGTAGDALTGGITPTSISGGAGADTLVGGVATDTINGGTGADTLTGGATAVNRFIFAAGDSPSTGRDSITDLKEGDIIQVAVTGVTNGGTLTTSSANAVYIDNVNNRLVVGADQITIPSTVANAAFTYSYGGDLLVGTADDTLTVGAAPLTATNNSLGTLTLTGKAIGVSNVVVSGSNAPTVGGTITGSNAVTTVTATNVTNQGINATLTGTVANALTITGTDQADTITGGSINDTLIGASGADLILAEGASSGAGTKSLQTIAASAPNAAASTYIGYIAGMPVTVTFAGGETTSAASTAIALAVNSDPILSKLVLATASSTTTAIASLIDGSVPTIATLTASQTVASGATTVSATTAPTATIATNVTSIVGGAGNDTLIGGAGSDTVTGGTGADSIALVTGADKVIVAAGDSLATIGGTTTSGTITGIDTVYGFTLGTGAVNSDELDVPGTAAKATATVGTDGTDSTLQLNTSAAVLSHVISANGVLTVDDVNTFAGAVTLSTTGDAAAVAQYLAANDIGDAGMSVIYTATISGIAHTYLYTQSTASAGGDLIDLVGVTATSLITTNATTSAALFIS